MDKTNSKKLKHTSTLKRPSQDIRQTKNFTLKDFLIAASLFVFALALYGNTFTHGYVLDDKIMITENFLVQKGISGIPEIISHGPLYGWKKINDGYRPFSLVTYAIEVSLFGFNSKVHHVFNVLIYAFTCVILFVLLRKLLSKMHVIVPMIITLLFLTHPIHTEVVANIKSRDELFSFLFLILSLWFLIYYIRSHNFYSMFLSLIMYFFSLISKENSITFLAVVPLTLYIFTELPLKKIFNYSLTYLGIAAIYLVLRWNIVDTDSFLQQTDIVNNSLVGAGSLSERIATAVLILGKYIILLFFPLTLSSEYGYNQIPNVGWADIGVLISFLVCLILILYATIKIRKKDMLSFSILFFFITISVVSNIFFLVGATLAERFLYTPSLGFCIALIYVPKKFWHIDFNNFRTKKVRIFLGAITVLVIAYSYRTIIRNSEWRDELSLFTSTVETSPNSMRAHWGLADVYKRMSENEENPHLVTRYLNKSVEHYKHATKILPRICEPWHILGYGLHALGNEEEAARVYLRALACDPKIAKTQNNMGLIYFNHNQYPEALKSFSEAVHLDSTYANAYGNLGGVYHVLGNYDSALVYYEKALSLDPNLESFRGYASELRKLIQK